MSIGLTDELTPLGSFHLLQDSYLKGGLRIVDDLAARNAIVDTSRKAGMLVWVQSESKTYRLGVSLLDASWVEVPEGGGTSSAIIFDSAATPVPNQIFDDFDLAFAFATSLASLSEIRLLTSVTLTSGSYDFTDIRLSAPPGLAITVSFTSSATISEPPPSLRDLILSMDVAGDLCTLATAGARTLELWGTSYISAAVASARAFNLTSASSSLAIRCHDTSQLYCSGTTNFAHGVNGSTIIVSLLDDSSIATGGGTPGLFFTGGASANIQVNLLGGWISHVGGSKTNGYINFDPLSSGSPVVGIIEATHRVYTKTYNITSTTNNNLDLFVNSYSNAPKIVRLTSAVTSPVITGITPNGDATLTEHLLMNVSATTITFTHNSGSSLAGYRFLCTNSTTISVPPNSGVHIVYDQPTAAWRVTPMGIPTAGVTNAVLADMANATFKGRTTAGTGVPEDLNATQATALLNAFTSGAGAPGLKGLVPAPTATDVTKVLQGDGTWVTQSGGGGITALTGDVTASGSGSVAATIANLAVTAAKIAANTITNSKLAQVVTATFKGRSTAGTGDLEDLTATQATALLNTFTSGSNNPGIKGLVPAPVLADVAKFLKADGTWDTPSGGGGGGATVTARTTVTNTNYTILNTDHIIYVSNTTTNVILTLPTPVGNNQMYEIKDIGGNFGGTFSVTLRPAGADTVEGLAADFLLEAPYANFRVIANTAGTGWYIH